MTSKIGGCFFLAITGLLIPFTTMADTSGYVPVFSPVVNGEGLRGLSTIGSAETMGEGRITFSLITPWYRQEIQYLNTPKVGADVFTTTGAFSYGANEYVDLFASVSGFGLSNNFTTAQNSGLGTIKAGAQGSLPFPKYAFIRMGGQAAIIGGTSQSQINNYRADGYNYLDTRTGYDFMGKLMQTVKAGNEDWGLKVHFNEAGVIGIGKDDPALLLLGTGVQGNLGFVVLGLELNSRTRFADMSFATDPLWFTPSLHLRTPYQVNGMVGVDVSLSNNRTGNAPRALEPYRVFGSVAFSFDMLAGKKRADALQKQKTADEKLALENKAARSANQVRSLTMQSVDDSIALANEIGYGKQQMDSMQQTAYDNEQANKATVDGLAKKATADSLALVSAANNLATEKAMRSDAEKRLLSTGELLLDAVYFETGKTVISINSKPYLNIIGKMLIKYPKLQIEVEGHTDNLGAKEYNSTLSQGRAESVRNYLTEVAPALSLTLSARGYGMSKPKADNNTADGRTENRRVELRVTNKNALMEYNQP